MAYLQITKKTLPFAPVVRKLNICITKSYKISYMLSLFAIIRLFKIYNAAIVISHIEIFIYHISNNII